MKHHAPTDDMQERAVLYALGALNSEEAATFEAHLAQGCESCEREVRSFRVVAAHLGYAASPHSPRPGVRDRLLARVAAEVDRDQLGSIIVRSTEGEWEAGGFEGVTVKRLFLDRADRRLVALARMMPGVRYPGHRHADTEELYLLDGDLSVEGQALRSGDYCAATAGTLHGETYSAGGCTFLLLASERDEIAQGSGTRTPQAGLVFVRSTEGAWQMGPTEGVSVKHLFTDPVRGTTTALLRVRPGTRFPRHRHATAEQLFMLAGDANVEGQALRAGDYYRAAAGSVHNLTYTQHGCEILQISSTVEMLA